MAPADQRTQRERARQAKAWSIALDPVYGIIGFGLVGYGIDYFTGTFPRWTGIMAILGLIAGFWRFIKEAKNLNAENSQKWAGRPYRKVEPDPEPDADDDPWDPDAPGGPKN